jgi:acyl-CoA hydrolase
VITGERKEVGRGVVVTGSAFGTDALYDLLTRVRVEFRPTSFTHDPAVLARLRSLVAINSAIEVDLAGNVNAETRRDHYVGARGGHRDFSRAASTTGRLSVVALRSRSGAYSTIVPRVETVTTEAAAVDVVVTEHGIAHLRGCAPAERARRLIAVAAPEFREELERAGDPLEVHA